MVHLGAEFRIVAPTLRRREPAPISTSSGLDYQTGACTTACECALLELGGRCARARVREREGEGVHRELESRYVNCSLNFKSSAPPWSPTVPTRGSCGSARRSVLRLSRRLHASHASHCIEPKRRPPGNVRVTALPICTGSASPRGPCITRYGTRAREFVCVCVARVGGWV